MRQYIIYQKICIVCMRNFDTTRINTLCCEKKCRNRLRYLPQKLINSLIEKFSPYTSIQKFGDSIVSSYNAVHGKPFSESELRLAQIEADTKARDRGVKKPIRIKNPDASSALPEIVQDNLKFINKEDPANGGADGFGYKSDESASILTTNTGMVDSNGADNSNSSSSQTDESNSEGHTDGLVSVGIQRRGLRRLGGIKQ